MQDTLRVMRRVFPFRNRSDQRLRLSAPPCLANGADRCDVPCAGLDTQEGDQETVRQASEWALGLPELPWRIEVCRSGSRADRARLLRRPRNTRRGGRVAKKRDRHVQQLPSVHMATEAKTVQEPITNDGTVSDRAVAAYMEVATRVVARCTDEQLGITPADYLDSPPSEDNTELTPAKAAPE